MGKGFGGNDDALEEMVVCTVLMDMVESARLWVVAEVEVGSILRMGSTTPSAPALAPSRHVAGSGLCSSDAVSLEDSLAIRAAAFSSSVLDHGKSLRFGPRQRM